MASKRSWRAVGIKRFVALLSAGVVLAVVASAPRRIRERIAGAVQDQCHRRDLATCSVDHVELAIDGVHFRGVRLATRQGRVESSVQRVAAHFSWGALILHRAQDVTIQASGLALTLRGSPQDIVTDLAVVPTAHGLPTAGRLRVERVTLEHVSVDLQPGSHGPIPLAANFSEGMFRWDRDHESTLQWSAGTVQLGSAPPLVTGACTVLRVLPGPVSVDCSGTAGQVDVATAVADGGVLARAFHSLRGLDISAGSSAEQASVGGHDDERPHQQVQVRIREGRIRVVDGGNTLANLDPATVFVTLESGAVQDARLQVGGDRAGNPSLSLSYAVTSHGWTVDLDGDGLPLRQLAPWVPAVPWHGTDAGIARAHVHVRPMEAPGVIRVDGDIAAENFGLQHPRLAHDPVDGLAVDVEGSAILDLPRRRIMTPGVTVHVNGLPITIAGWFQRREHQFAMDASMRVPELACDDIRRALPSIVTGPVGDFEFAGSLGGDIHLALDTDHLAETALNFDVRNDCAVVHQGVGANLRRFGLPFVQRVEEPGGVVRAFVTGPGAPAWVPFEAISPYVAAAVVHREDGGFYRHHGFSVDEIRGALVRNLGAGRFAFGASTLSMQLVKNVFLAREKTLVRKIQEVALTWWLEQSVDKRTILELYLNVVEFGPGIYGIGPAARFFFGRQPADLTPLQSIYLATLLPAPIPRYVNFERGSVTGERLARLRAIARSMGSGHMLTPVEVAAAEQEALVFRPAHTPIPGPTTLNVDPTTSDDQAAGIAASQPPSGIYPAAGDTPEGSPDGESSPGPMQDGEEAGDDGSSADPVVQPPASAPHPSR